MDKVAARVAGLGRKGSPAATAATLTLEANCSAESIKEVDE